MSIFYVILAAMIAGDLAWWFFALRRLPRRWMRVTAGLFAALMLLGILGMLVARRIDFPLEDSLPRWWHSIIFIWHLLILLPWLIVQSARGIVQLGRWVATRFTHADPS